MIILTSDNKNIFVIIGTLDLTIWPYVQKYHLEFFKGSSYLVTQSLVGIQDSEGLESSPSLKLKHTHG